MIAKYHVVYQELDFQPTRTLFREAEQRPGRFYTEDLTRRAELHGGVIETEEGCSWQEFTFVELARLFETSLSEVSTPDNGIILKWTPWINGMLHPDTGSVLLNGCAEVEVKRGHEETPVATVYSSRGVNCQVICRCVDI